MTTTTDVPLVSIIIPTYNYAAYLPTAIDSCLRQSYQALEIIVIDDGSTDNTKEIAEGYGDRIVYVRQENSGVSLARNRGLERATGSFITFLDADDYMYEDAIQVRLDTLLKNPDAGAVATETCSKKGEKLSCKPRFGRDTVSNKFYEDLLLGRFPFATSAILIRSHIAKQFSFPPGLSNGEDIVYFTKIFFVAPVCYVRRATNVSVWHEDSLRHDIGVLKEQGIKLVEAIFDDPFYQGKIDYLRKDFTANRHLELSRKLYRYGEKKLARTHYMKALCLKPGRIFRTNYLIKFIKACF